MSDQLARAAAGDEAQRPDWQWALDSLERSLREASQAVALLRHVLQGEAPASIPQSDPLPPSPPAPAPMVQPAPPSPTPAPAPIPAAPEAAPSLLPRAELVPMPEGAPGVSAFDRLWDRIEREKMEKQTDAAAEPSEQQPVDGLPQLYLMTVEDREGGVDLVPLHRSLAALRGIQEVSLVSYANGVPVISLRTAVELDLNQLGTVVSAAMDRECEVIPQDRGRLYLRLKAS